MSTAVLDQVNKRILEIENGEYNPQITVKKSRHGLVVVSKEYAPHSRYKSVYVSHKAGLRIPFFRSSKKAET